jgi:hypothetical protein
VNRPPDFHELFDEPSPEDERERLRRAHDLIVQAGPLPEVPPWLEQPPSPWDDELSTDFFSRPRSARGFARRRRLRSRGYAMLALAAAIAVIAFFAGYTASGNHGSRFASQFNVPMRGTTAAPGALAALLVSKRDGAGNWPMLLRVEGLKQLPPGAYYELFLTLHGKPAATCGTFRVTSRVTEIRLNAPYDFRKFTGWVVTRHDVGARGSGAILLRTKRV